MADDTPTTPAEGSEIVPLHEARERADDQAAETIAQLVKDSSKALFREQLGQAFDDIRHWPPPAVVAAGALGVAARDLTRVNLPATYQAAVAALRQCARVDECRDLENKAAALAAYARQARDTELLALAVRIRARSVRRCGELLREIEAARGRRTDLELRAGDLPKSPTRAGFAAAGGLSEHQRKTALRLAAVPSAEFETAVEGPRPATICALAERGRTARRWKPPQTERSWLAVDVAYNRRGTLAEVASERELAVLMAAWRDAGPEARRRFLRAIGCAAAETLD